MNQGEHWFVLRNRNRRVRLTKAIYGKCKYYDYVRFSYLNNYPSAPMLTVLMTACGSAKYETVNDNVVSEIRSQPRE